MDRIRNADIVVANRLLSVAGIELIIGFIGLHKSILLYNES